jgi:hypothetical protein
MKKRGTSQVDWAISLALFLLYVVWFFIFVRPQFTGDELQTSLVNVLENDFVEDYKWAVNKLPLIVKTNVTNAYEPIIADFSYSWNINKTKLDNFTELVYDNNKIIFLGNLSAETKIFWLLNSIKNYTARSYIKDLNANSTTATTGSGLKIFFENNLFEEISYNNTIRLNNTELHMGGELIEMDSNSSSFYDTAAIYRIETEAANHTSYIFPRNSFIYNYLNLNREESYTFTFFADLHDYTKYYASNLYYGNISYDNPDCLMFNSDRITFYDTNSITFYFNGTASINFCYGNDKINFSASLTLENETFYKIYLHGGNFSNVELNRYEYNFGAMQKEKGLYFDDIQNLNYDNLKNAWGISDNREFKITIWNTTSSFLMDRANVSLFELGEEPRNVRDIAVNEWNDYILSDDGSLTPVIVNIKSW